LKRQTISLLIAMLFVTLAVTGLLGFFLPFNLLIVSVHSLIGFVFIVSIGFHIKNNFRQLRSYFANRTALILFLIIISFIAIIIYQPAPVKAILSLSNNKGPALDHFEIQGNRMTYTYAPAPHYHMQLDFKGGSSFQTDAPPSIAIWIENKSGYHIKSLYHSELENFDKLLPYWHHKRAEYFKNKELDEKKKRDTQSSDDLDALSSATDNYSFDPKDYIVPEDPAKETPYRVMIEINLPGDANEHYQDQPSLVYSVEVDNKDPRAYQVLEIVGFPKTEVVDGETKWSLYYADETITTARDLYDSALLQIDRSTKP
jgi:hypothetical protein